MCCEYSQLALDENKTLIILKNKKGMIYIQEKITLEKEWYCILKRIQYLEKKTKTKTNFGGSTVIHQCTRTNSLARWHAHLS